MVSASLLTTAPWFIDVVIFGSDHLPTYKVIKGICGGPQKLRGHGTNLEKFGDFRDDGSVTRNKHEKFADDVSNASAHPKDTASQGGISNRHRIRATSSTSQKSRATSTKNDVFG